ncbi:transposase [Sphingomonas sp. GC_Shp_3]|uniref:transposase n=1 Tax=Sphingomonas sp. GC_Shp_3 TaxID=2937383 RepID=UPI00226AF3FE|nr:transposase [Sphingomonas sp. GC_Shp_3]
MPRVIATDRAPGIGLDDLAEALDTARFDVRDEESLVTLGPLLARLGRNPHFLGDLVIAELERRCVGQAADNAYGAQVFMLKPPNGRYLLRANFWPARGDAVVRASGTASFFYDLPHDHNFPFLTYGYEGPGYWSDYYDYDVTAVAGLPGEHAGLRFVGRSRLEPGKLMLYRARRDVHVQLPPDSFSVSLNILFYDVAQPWLEQFQFDVAQGTIATGLTTAPAEGLVTLAAQLGGPTGIALCEEFAARHPVPRMRATAYAALASALPDRDARAALLATAAGDADRYVAGHARLRLARIEQAANQSITE